MSMLAGPRRKQKVINLRAKNNEWSNDKNKFGQRMLEKMGWSEGKGLGANENGIVEHVIARYKNDEKGLGYVDRNDQWTKHEDDFNALLANLSNSGDQNQSPEVLHSGKSLETKSKKSKARIHYHKFTRGKDIARYSEKDLANIFGKKTLKPNEKEEAPKEEDNTEKVFTEKGSMYDYFKNKMTSVNNVSSKLSEINKDDDEDILDHSFRGFSNSNSSPQDSEKEETKTENSNSVFSFYPQMSINNCNKQVDVSNGDKEEVQKSKKKKKSKEKEISCIASDHEVEEELNQKKKKSKKRSQEENRTEHEAEQEEEQIVKKKKKKDKVPDIQHAEESTEVAHKKKKKKNKKH